MHGLVDLLAEESERNAEFADKLDTLLSELPEKKHVPRKPGRTPPEHLPDIHTEWSARGETGFRLWLQSQPIPMLRAIIRAEDLDAARRTSKWKDAGKLAGFIVDSIPARQSRGSAFIGRGSKPVEVSMEEEKRTALVFTCPNCLEKASGMYTKRDLETALEVGELSMYDIKCDHSWKEKLGPDEKAHLRDALDKGLLFS
jgi:hypothetical protein